MQKKKIQLNDLPTWLSQLLHLYWAAEEATPEERHLPEAEMVDAFLTWLSKQGEETGMAIPKDGLQFLMENGYSPIQSGSQTM